MNHETGGKPVSIHMIGICGVAMGSLAGMLKQLGYRVSGSDEHIYPPMSDMLREWGVPVCEGFSAGNVDSPDLVIIGNAISRGNPEAERVLDGKIPYMSMAQALRDLVFGGREVIAVAGTHGKTTTTALLAHILDVAGMRPSFFVGGVAGNYGSNFRLDEGRHFVIEGDEYDSAFFEKIPKFILYRPHHCVLTSLEFDHADIYSNMGEISLWFKRLVNIVPSRGHIVYSAGCDALAGVVSASRSQLTGFGGDRGEVRWRFLRRRNGIAEIEISDGAASFQCGTSLIGSFNYMNIAAAAAMALRLGVAPEAIIRAVGSFRGVRRRQELIFSGDRLLIYEDFAHHPTAITLVLEAFRAEYPDARIWAVYEPRSATSRRNVFQNELPASFARANHVLIKNPFKLESIPEGERIDIGRVVDDIRARGVDANLFSDVESIIEYAFAAMDRGRSNVIIIMSNGGFDGIYTKITARAGRE